MCGLAGVSGRFERDELVAAIAALSHRGPDDSGVFENLVDEIGLAHARLAILDLSPFGHQPMQSPDGSVVLVFNGEVYNYRELRRELESEGQVFKGGSDTEVLLHLYLDNRRRGASIEEMLRRINGMFSLAFWDLLASLWLSRETLWASSRCITPRCGTELYLVARSRH